MAYPVSFFNINFADIIGESMGADLLSESVEISEANVVCVQFSWISGGSPVGYLTLQCSNNNEDFVTVATASLNTNSGSVAINFEKPGFFFARIGYTRVSGTATVSYASMTAKV